MLLYVGFFILIFAGGVLSDHKPPPCEDPEPECPLHEHYTYDSTRCIRTCANKWLPISDGCKSFTGCVCDDRHVRLNDDGSGRCVPEHKCPCREDPKNPDHEHCGGKKCSDPNAVYTDHLNPCPLTCDHPNPRPCPKMPTTKGGCECAEGYLLNEDTGRCVRPKDCPKKKCRDPNAVYVKCPNPCPLSCEHPFPRICRKACKEFGCQCAPGFLLDYDDSDGICIRPEDCLEPICCPKNEYYVMDDCQCPKTCGNRLLPNSDEAGPCSPFTGCACKPGYVRKYKNATGPCIKERKCPPIPTCYGENEEPTSCATICPPQTCDSIFSKYYCVPTECQPGCDCKNGFLRNKDGVCIPAEDCFKPDPIECNGPNEIYSDCAITCPPQTCESLYTDYDCRNSKEKTCAPGCNCIEGYLRNRLGVCIPSEECCDDPAGCDGDLNATRVRGCGSDNPPTCENPEPEDCNVCKLNACECKPGYILSCDDGDCIATKDCPGGSPNCGTNKTYVVCKFDCPNNYCPIDDSRVQLFCTPPYVCKGGCACKPGYLLVSPEDPRCILASDCPDVECTRQNEVWDPKPTSSYLERCEDQDGECDHPYPPGPRCVCKEGFCRNASDICVPVSDHDCGCKGDMNATYSVCPNFCPATCDDRNPTGACPLICVPGCECNPGYVLDKGKGGKCILPIDCPDEGCNGDPNAEYSECPSACPATCDDPDPQCELPPSAPGCVCKAGLVLNTDTGLCVELEDCPGDCGCKGDMNATYKECASACPLTCDDQDPNRICPLICKPGCECNPGYVRTVKGPGGECILPIDCPDDCGCKGDMNATYSDCTSPCPTTCGNRHRKGDIMCAAVCIPGCMCKPDYILTAEEGGICILIEDCPDEGCNGDPNAEYSECPSACPATCDDPDPQCELPPSAPGCVCKAGLVLNTDTGLCVELEDCPDDCGCKGDMNATYKECASPCPLTCDDQDPNRICPLICKPGCECNPGYVRTVKGKDGKCILPIDCPDDCGCKGDMNATYSDCTSPCPTTCANRHRKGDIMCAAVCIPGCMCKADYILTAEEGGICILPEDCPDEGCNGDPNAEYSECPSACPATCEDPDPQCELPPSAPGCVCKAGLVLNTDTGLCVELEDCPDDCGCKGDMNATYKECASPCPLTCDNQDPNRVCSRICKPGCECNPGYVRTVKGPGGECILPIDCPDDCGCKGDMNATYSDCTSPCPTTCANRHRKGDIKCPAVCIPGCMCKPDYILTAEEGGICILPEDCPDEGCGGDPNAEYSECPSTCPATCENSDPHQRCTRNCGEPGCVCKREYVKFNGKCIKPEACPDCGPNAEYSECPSTCPATCDDPYPICTKDCGPPGCVCKPGFVWARGKCIRLEDCQDPPFHCGGDCNATYDKCPSCYQPTCKNPDPDDCLCKDLCAPAGCVCKEGYLKKNTGGLCIRPEDCPGGWPTCRENETYVNCKIGCPSNYCPVDDSLDTVVCDPMYPCPGGCACKGGYLMDNEDNERCILSCECPPVECTRPNEYWDPYAPACLHERCDDRHIPCDFPYPGRPRCRCIANHYRDEDNICVPECECPEPEPICGYNEVAVPCRQICPPQNCEIAYTEYACTEEYKICESGCDCLPDHLRNGSGICIPTDKCPYPSTPLCGINEIAKDCRRICPPQTCLSKYALVFCHEDIPCEPGCDCVPNYLRDDRGICVPSYQCPEPCQIPNECKRTCAEPNPPNCVYKPPKHNMDGCDCKEGYILSYIGGECIPIDKCPPHLACHGDPNARPKRCPKPCPSTCEAPDQKPCKMMCQPIACECKDGYILSNNTECARCILPDSCPGGNPCGEGSHFVDCKREYPRDYCPVDDRRDQSYNPSEDDDDDDDADDDDVDDDCLSGCICDLNHKRKSHKDPRCIVSSKCPPINCTRPNEKWSCCPSACLAENCEDVNNQPTVCNTLVLNCEPRCICRQNHFRNARGICIPAKDCPPVCKDPNAVYKVCTSACEPTCANRKPEVCTDDCKPPGCVCKDGYLLNEDIGLCVQPSECPEPVCTDPNAVYKTCTSGCEPTCANPEPEVCTLECKPPGCVCKEGYVLNEKTGLCVLPCECPDC